MTPWMRCARFCRAHWPQFFLAASLGFSSGLVLTASRPVAYAKSEDGVPLQVLANVAKVKPLARDSEPAWRARHQKIVHDAKARNANLILLGDSITQGWEHQFALQQKYFGSYRTLNAGIASDRVEHVLWRVEHGLFAVARPDLVVLLAGVNNLAVSSPEAIAAGHYRIIEAIKTRSPETKILLLGVFPSGAEANHKRRAKITRLNTLLAALGGMANVTYRDIGSTFLAPDATISKRIMFDYLHLTAAGYERWGRSIKGDVDTLMGH